MSFCVILSGHCTSSLRPFNIRNNLEVGFTNQIIMLLEFKDLCFLYCKVSFYNGLSKFLPLLLLLVMLGIEAISCLLHSSAPALLPQA